MPDRRPFSLRQVDGARTEFALLEAELDFLKGQIARLPTRAYLCRTALLATASLWALVGAVALYVMQ
jgi:hypothetical protein